MTPSELKDLLRVWRQANLSCADLLAKLFSRTEELGQVKLAWHEMRQEIQDALIARIASLLEIQGLKR